MIISHQKMAQDLKCRKLFYRPEPSIKTLEKLRRSVEPPKAPTLLPPPGAPQSPVSPDPDPGVNPRPNALVRRSNTVRIYVPFESKSQTSLHRDDDEQQLDVTTRRIEIPVPRLMRPKPCSPSPTPVTILPQTLEKIEEIKILLNSFINQ